MTGQSTGRLGQSGAGRGDGWQHEARKRYSKARIGEALRWHGTGAIGAALQWMGMDGEDRGAGD